MQSKTQNELEKDLTKQIDELMEDNDRLRLKIIDLESKLLANRVSGLSREDQKIELL